MNTIENIADTDIYEKLRRELDKMPVGMPKSEKDLEINILRRLFSPEEARIALYLNMISEPVETIHKRMLKDHFEMPYNLLEEHLARMSQKGLIFKRKSKKHYSYAMLVLGIYELQVDHMTKDFC